MRVIAGMALLVGVLGLGACGGSGDVRSGGAGVEDRSGGAAGVGSGSGNVGGSDTGGVGSQGGFSGHPLDDPSSPLSKRRLHFAYDSYEIDSRYQGIAESHGRYLASHPSAAVTLEGHADERGSREYNIALGERRAYAVQQIMLAAGASPRQLTTVSYGEEKPLASCSSDECWWENRRVEIVYTAR